MYAQSVQKITFTKSRNIYTVATIRLDVIKWQLIIIQYPQMRVLCIKVLNTDNVLPSVNVCIKILHFHHVFTISNPLPNGNGGEEPKQRH